MIPLFNDFDCKTWVLEFDIFNFYFAWQSYTEEFRPQITYVTE